MNEEFKAKAKKGVGVYLKVGAVLTGLLSLAFGASVAAFIAGDGPADVEESKSRTVEALKYLGRFGGPWIKESLIALPAIATGVAIFLAGYGPAYATSKKLTGSRVLSFFLATIPGGVTAGLGLIVAGSLYGDMNEFILKRDVFQELRF